MPTIGESFKAAREARGVSLVEAGKSTRIMTSQLQALELDDYRKIPAAPYARGFIKIYAQYLHLDPAPLLDQYNAKHGKASPPPAPVSTAPVRQRVQTKPVAVNPPASAQPVQDVPASQSVDPSPLIPSPAPELYAPILPVAGVVPAKVPDELPLLSAPLEVPSGSQPSLFASERTIVQESSAAPVTQDQPVPEPEPVFLEKLTPPVTEFASNVVPEPVVREEHPATSALDNRFEEARKADQRNRLRQALIVVIAVIAFAGVLSLIRKLIRDSSPTTGDLQGKNAMARGLVAPPPEPYLEGR